MPSENDIVVDSIWIRTSEHSCGCSSCKSEYKIEHINADIDRVTLALFKAFDDNAAKKEYVMMSGFLRNWILLKPGARKKSGFGSFVTSIESR